jgi:hypothetical protein
MRLRHMAVASAGLLALTACSPAAHSAAASSPPTTSSTASSTPTGTVSASPLPSPVTSPRPTVAQVTAWVNAAKLSATAIGATKPVNDIAGVAPTIAVCNVGIAADHDELFAHYWRWVGTRIPYVEHAVFGYPTAADNVVAQIRKRSSSCRSYDQKDSSGSGRVAFAGSFAFKPIAGIDGAYAFCEKSTELSPAKAKGQIAYICTAAISRQDVLVTVRVFGSRSTLASAHAALGPPLRLAEAALVKAVPAP